MSARETFLANVRKAVADGNVAGQARSLPTGPRVAYQGAGPNPVQHFADELRAAGGQCHVVRDLHEAARTTVSLVDRAGAKRVLLNGELTRCSGVRELLTSQGLQCAVDVELPSASAKDQLFAADVGVTGVDWLIAETGSLVVVARQDQPRSSSLLPPVHIALAERRQILPDLFDLFDALGDAVSPPQSLPSCVTLITGPSKTGDIELRLVTGVHGPGELHVVLIDS
jgi:L-lactate utilization protein LutC